MWDTRRDLTACFTMKYVALWFPSLALKLVETRRRVVLVAPSQMLRQDQVEDGRVDIIGCVGPCYPYFTIFYILCTRGIVVF
jgi:hypothetical protein